ncbi:hypothetical protein C2S52_015575, partial [Perilla frutescens var. hirtella]
MATSNISGVSPPVFTGENYHVWSVKMQAYLKGLLLWEAVETEMETNLPNNPTINQLKVYEEKVSRKFRALSTLHAAVDETIFTRIMDCGSAKEVWDKLQTEFQGNEKTKKMQVFNLRKEFELLKMKETENIKEYIDKVMKVVNQIRLLGEELPEKRIVEKVMVTLPERFESKISSLEDTCDMTKLTLTELVSALQAVEQRKAFREEEKSVEKALAATQKTNTPLDSNKKRNFQARKGKERKDQQGFKGKFKKEKYPPCPHCKKTNHAENYCWFRPGVQCRSCKQFGHIEKVCPGNRNKKAEAQPAQVSEEVESQEENLFVATVAEQCVASTQNPVGWLIDSGCTHHMTSNLQSFKMLDRGYFSKVKIGDGRWLDVHGKGV